LSEEEDLTHKDEFEHAVKLDVEARAREGVRRPSWRRSSRRR
jgi:hypothetical protein